MGNLLQAGIQAGGSFLGSIANTIGNAVQNRKMREYDREMTEYQYSKDLEQWHRQNEYNSPEKQMERFGKAGLNPHLIYGKGTSGNATASPSYTKPTAHHDFKPLNVPNMIGQYADLKVKQAQTNNLKEQNLNLQEDRVTKALTNIILGYKAHLSPHQYKYQTQNFELLLEQQKSQNTKAAAEAGISEEQLEWMKKKLEVYGLTGVNIDKDNPTYRVGMKAFEKLWEGLQNMSDFQINDGWNPPVIPK